MLLTVSLPVRKTASRKTGKVTRRIRPLHNGATIDEAL